MTDTAERQAKLREGLAKKQYEFRWPGAWEEATEIARWKYLKETDILLAFMAERGAVLLDDDQTLTEKLGEVLDDYDQYSLCLHRALQEQFEGFKRTAPLQPDRAGASGD